MIVHNLSIYSFYLKNRDYQVSPGANLTIDDALWASDDELARTIESLDNHNLVSVSERPVNYPRTREFPEVVNIIGDNQGAGAFVIPVADEGSVSVDLTHPNPIYPAAGNMQTLVFPRDTVFLSVALEGDDFPRWLISSDPNDGFYMGVGTYNPYSSGSNFYVRSNDGGLVFYSRGVLEFRSDDHLDIRATSILASFCIVEPDDSLVNASGFAIWLDFTPGAPSLKIKAKDENEVFYTASIPLTERGT